MNHEHFTDEQIIAALKETFGKVYLAAERLGCHPSTIYERSEKSPEIAQTLEHYPGRMIDIAETSLASSVLAGEPWAVRFALRTLGQKRGYTERPPVPPPAPRTTMKEMAQEMIEADELFAASRKHRAEMTFTFGDPPKSYEELEAAVNSLAKRVGRPQGSRKKLKTSDQAASTTPSIEPGEPTGP